MTNQIQDWRARLAELGKEYFVIEEMMRMGFLKLSQDQLNALKTGYKELGRINTELGKLNKELQGIQDVTPILKEIRKNRIERVKAKKAIRKIEKQQEAEERKKQIAERKKTTPSHLGDGVSKGLKFDSSDTEKLKTNNLPVLHNIADLAKISEMEEKQWIWLSYHRRAASIDHYTRFQIPKKKGGMRDIASPKKTLRKAQSWVLENILAKRSYHPKAMAFVKDKSINHNAQAHLNKKIVVRIDLKDFFPSVKFPRVKGLFKKMGYNEGLATLFALVCTDAYRVTAKLSGKEYYVALGERFLPQGACTSPMLTNIICLYLDHRLDKLAEKAGWTYTRYADDLVFSTNDAQADMGKFIKLVGHIIKDEGFEVNKEKTMVMRKHQRQAVTGIVVNNDDSRISRRDIRKFRAFLHQLETKGEQTMNEKLGKSAKSYAKGYLAFVQMVNPEQAKKFKEQYSWLA